MGAAQQFSLRWNNYSQYITDAFDNLRTEEDLVDVTLSCEGRKIYAHKMMLSACSIYFKDVFKDNPCKHPVIIFRDVKYEDLLAIIDFMYHGEVNVEQEHLSSFLHTAEMLTVQGLSVCATAPKEEQRKRQSIFFESPSVSQEARQNNIKVLSRSLAAQNPPSPFSSPRPLTPPRKRRLSPPFKSNSDKESAKRKPKESLASKVDSEPIEDESMLQEEESLAATEMSQEESSPPVVKVEAPCSPEPVSEKIMALELQKAAQAGTSSNMDTAGEQKDRSKLQMWVCEICGKCFKHKDSRRQHYKSHEGSTECPICHNVLSRKYELKVHMRKRHNMDLFGQSPLRPRTDLAESEYEFSLPNEARSLIPDGNNASLASTANI